MPFFREVERLGWRWVGRVRGRDYIKLKQRWRSCKRLFEEATTTPSCLGSGQWVRSNPLRALFVLVLIASLAAIVLWLMGRRQSARDCTSGCVGAVVNVALTPTYSWRRS